MTRMVQCEKLQAEKEGLPYPPFPNEMGERIFNAISKEAWEMWLGQQTILINEHRLSTLDPKAKTFLKTEMEKFLFDENAS